jgi:hypothetical protein
MRADPPLWLKILFWVILGAFSTYFAEVLSGSDPFPFFHPWGILAVCPLYALHALLLTTIVFRFGRPMLLTLFAAGTLFGMYEAYMTKALWDPSWGDAWLSLGGIAVSELLVLVLFWHPFLSFIVPLFVCETMLTSSHEIWAHLPNAAAMRLADSRRRRWLLACMAGASFGVMQSVGAQTIWQSLLSGVATTAVLLVLVWLWRNRTPGSDYGLRALLPNGRELAVLAGMLALMYLGLGVLLRPEALPGLGPQVVIWLIYAGLIALLVPGLRRSRAAPPPVDTPTPPEITWQRLAVFGLLLSVFSALWTLLPGLSQAIVGLMWLAGAVFGLVMLFLTIRAVLRSRDDPLPQTS